ncbi:SpoIIE family protein phosphatase [Desulfonatronum thioautotrophicum]|uniref:SpoIIE family protein phosphatase n=1 Tax=Desulfonatronum thioautotrophicum TaxID=617001 RepID=UPI00069C8B3F|nr:SpoIIE family protein phosphatase [Desulfonatronum thioautotrophicum]
MTRTSPSRKQRLAVRLALFVLGSTGLIFALVFFYNHHLAREMMLKTARSEATGLAQNLVQRLEAALKRVEDVPGFLALYVERQTPSEQELVSMLHDLLARNPDIYGASVALEPHGTRPDQRFFAPYVFRDQEGRLITSDVTDPAYNYFGQDWYNEPRMHGRSVWSEPYFDEGGGNAMMVTHSVPIYRSSDAEMVFLGVSTADVSLEHLTRRIAALTIYESGHAMLISRSGQFLSHPNPEWIYRKTAFDVAAELGIPELHEIANRMISGEEGDVDLINPHTSQPSRLYFTPVPSTGWALGMLVPKAEIYADIAALNRFTSLIGGAGFLLLVLVVIVIARSITRPLHGLVATTGEIAKGQLDVPMPAVRVNDEIGQLTRSVDMMRLALLDYIANLTETTKAKERIESELVIARNIQMSFLPRRFPTLKERSDFDLHALLEPARHVGGDLYDFFFLDEHHLFFSVGDVSDKGVPAALFMAVTKTLMKGIAEHGLEPSEILGKVNVELCQGNEASMFVTLFCGILDLRNGVMHYSNAGHNPPVLIRKDQAPQWMTVPPGLVLGGMEESIFQTRKIDLHPGDTLLLYTDGVTEAQNPGDELYSDDRLLQEIQARAAASPEELVVGIMESVHRFATGAPQSDDITLLALLYRGDSSTEQGKI